jgi:hypothetical protein
MVISAATPDVSTTPYAPYAPPTPTPELEVVERERSDPRGVASSAPPTLCRRCDTRLMRGYDEPQCPTCSYVDYSQTLVDARVRARCIISSATLYVLRYVGDFPSLSDTLTHVKLIRVRNRVTYAVNCPFCDRAMDQSSLSGKRPDVREQRYKCMDGHRVSLVPRKNGALGWK